MLFLPLLLPLLEPAQAEAKALAFLAREVPQWSVQNKCFSCHNNGDAARALFTAVRLGHKVPAQALTDTTRWLARPGDWDHNGGEGPYNDKRLARLQFAGSLTEAIDTGLVKDPEALRRAAELVASHQDGNGSWPVVDSDTLGSPISRGVPLATSLARHILQRADAHKYEHAIAKADKWIRSVPIHNILDAAAVLLGLEKAEDEGARKQRRRCQEVIRKGESKEGGWGPYVTSPSEVFDTALVVIALVTQPVTQENQNLIERGRAYLIATQREDGSWPETTRPSGGQSYAQRLSTAGWATLALLTSRAHPIDLPGR
jgi:hypothetical protein